MENQKYKENPYEHQEAIKDSSDFIGREEEVEEIDYLLSQGKNIGIIGKRGAGKTSLSYILEEKANNHGILPVRVTLNEEEAKDEVILFREIISSITRNVGDDVHSDYVNWLAGMAKEVRFNFKFLKVHFTPGQEDAPDRDKVMESTIKQDLAELQEETEKEGIVLIIDNAHHLKHNKILLQKFRSIFSELESYSLVFVGTEDTFSDIKSIYSPIARMFNQIKIDSFKSYGQAKACILSPLTPEEKNNIKGKTIGEIYRITGGRPYEINLVGFYMYKDYDRGQAENLELSSRVINKVINGIEDWRRPSSDDIIGTLNELDDDQLRVLISVIEVPTLNREAIINYSVIEDVGHSDDITARKAELQDCIDDLLEEGLVEEKEGGLGFSGDLYCLAYVKYYAYSRGVLEDLGGTHGKTSNIIHNIHHKLVDKNLIRDIDESHSHYIPDELSSKPLLRGVSEWSGEEIDEEIATLNDLAVTETVYEDWYRKVLYEDNHEYSYGPERTTSFRLNVKWVDSGFKSVIHSETEEVAEQVKEKIRNLIPELERIGVGVIFKTAIDYVADGAEHQEDDNLLKAIDSYSDAIDVNENQPEGWYYRAVAYAKAEKFDKALKDINEALNLRPDWTDAYISKAKILLHRGEEEDAKETLLKGASINKDNPDVWAEAIHVLDGWQYPELAIEIGESALEAGSVNNHLKYHLGRVYRLAGRQRDAVDILKQVDRDSEYFISVEEEKLYTFVIQGENKKSEEVLERLEDQTTDLGDIYYKCARIKHTIGDTKKGLAYLEQAVEYDDSLSDVVKDDDLFNDLQDEPEFLDIVE